MFRAIDFGKKSRGVLTCHYHFKWKIRDFQITCFAEKSFDTTIFFNFSLFMSTKNSLDLTLRIILTPLLFFGRNWFAPLVYSNPQLFEILEYLPTIAVS